VARREFQGGIARTMKKGWSVLAARFAVVTLVLSFATSPAFARAPRIAAPKAFKADFSYQAGSNPPEQGVMYFSHGRIREEITPAGGGPKAVTIIDQVTKTIYVLDTEKKTFKVLPWDARSALISEALRRFEKRELVGSKTIDGQECDDFEIHPKNKSIAPFHFFVNQTTRSPVQLVSEDADPAKQIQIKWTNVKAGYQAAIMFAPPLGYQETK
jgi:outer membrane lipoprotein-sorting protein